MELEEKQLQWFGHVRISDRTRMLEKALILNLVYSTG
jgi:hypothetical protein